MNRPAMKVALLVVSLAWLATWGVVGAFFGVEPWALAAYAVVIVAFGVAGRLGARGGRGRAAGVVFAVALTVALAWVTFMDLRVPAGAAGVLASIAIAPSRGDARERRRPDGSTPRRPRTKRWF